MIKTSLFLFAISFVLGLPNLTYAHSCKDGESQCFYFSNKTNGWVQLPNVTYPCFYYHEIESCTPEGFIWPDDINHELTACTELAQQKSDYGGEIKTDKVSGCMVPPPKLATL